MQAAFAGRAGTAVAEEVGREIVDGMAQPLCRCAAVPERRNRGELCRPYRGRETWD